MQLGALVQDGRLAWRDPDRAGAYLRRLEGQRLVVTIKRPADPTTLDQHGYYRAVVLPLLAEEWGWGNPAELHHELKLLHLPGIIPAEEWPRRKLGGQWQMEPPSMGDMSMDESRQLIDKVLAQAADDGIVVPPPRGKAGA